MARGGVSQAALGETQYQIGQSSAETQEVKHWGAEFSSYKNVKAVME
jgi:hypothetical protein